jgi:hypothetical protein
MTPAEKMVEDPRKGVGIGVIGLGMGANLLYVNREPGSRLEVRGLCATNLARTASGAKEWQITFRTDDYRDFLARDDIQASGPIGQKPGRRMQIAGGGVGIG